MHSRTKRLTPVATFTWRRYITPLARPEGELRGGGDRRLGKFERAVPVAQATEVMNEGLQCTRAEFRSAWPPSDSSRSTRTNLCIGLAEIQTTYKRYHPWQNHHLWLWQGCDLREQRLCVV